MTQALVLKVMANGTTTSPVLRGKWITERLLGYEIPPPPVPAVEPDIRGAVTIRQQLDQHRADASIVSPQMRLPNSKSPFETAVDNMNPLLLFSFFLLFQAGSLVSP